MAGKTEPKKDKNNTQSEKEKRYRIKIDIEKQKKELRKLKSNSFNERIANTLRTLPNFLLLFIWVVFILFLVALVVAIIFYFILVIKDHDNDFLVGITTVVQILTGIISLGVGVWALILTQKSRKESKELYEIVLNINRKTSDPNTSGKPEDDVNPSSL